MVLLLLYATVGASGHLGKIYCIIQYKKQEGMEKRPTGERFEKIQHHDPPTILKGTALNRNQVPKSILV